MLAEWNPQQTVIVTWPHQHSDWQAQLTEIEACYQTIVATIARYQAIMVICYDNQHREQVQQQLAAIIDQAKYAIELPVIPSNDTWVRDYGPLRVSRDGTTVLVNTQFNAWGGKYAFGLDNLVSARLAGLGLLPYPMQASNLVLEGGAIDSNGCGALLTTSRCLLSPTRNGEISRTAMAQQLQQLLGVSKVHWLESGYLAGDDTDCHIDMLARFVAKNHIVYQSCDDAGDEHYQQLQQMAQELAALRNFEGHPYQLTPLPWPPAVVVDGQRRPASYANFLIINDAVLVPSYAVPADQEAVNTDQQALAVLAKCFPDRKVHAIPCLPLIKQRGSLHCATMQV